MPRFKRRRRTQTGATIYGSKYQRTSTGAHVRARAPRGRFAGYYRRAGNYGRYQPNMGGELKFKDTDVDDAAIAATGTVQGTGTFLVIVQDNGESERVGRKITIRSISWRYRLSLGDQDAGATPPDGDTVRLILFQDKQCNGATAVVGDLLQSSHFQSFNELTNSGRFRTLMDKTVDLNRLNLASDGAGLVSSTSVRRSGTFFKKCAIPIEYSNATGAIAGIKSNNLGIMAISAGGTAVLGSTVRVRYSDT